MGDTDIMFGIVGVFVILGIMLPFINEGLNNEVAAPNTQGIENIVGQSDISASKVFTSIFQMFFWTFGELPFWLDAIFVIFRLMFAWLIVKLIRGVAG